MPNASRRHSTPAARNLRDRPYTLAETLARANARLLEHAQHGRADDLARLIAEGADIRPLLNMDSTPGKQCILLAGAKSSEACFRAIWDKLDRTARQAKLMMSIDKLAASASAGLLDELCALARESSIAQKRIESSTLLAADNNNPQKTSALLALSAPDARFGDDRATPFMLLCEACSLNAWLGHSVERPELLVEWSGRCDIELQDAKGRTALARVILKGHASTAKLLLTLGCDPFIRDHFGRDCADHCQSGNYRLLRELGVSLAALREARVISAHLGSAQEAPKPPTRSL